MCERAQQETRPAASAFRSHDADDSRSADVLAMTRALARPRILAACEALHSKEAGAAGACERAEDAQPAARARPTHCRSCGQQEVEARGRLPPGPQEQTVAAGVVPWQHASAEKGVALLPVHPAVALAAALGMTAPRS